jgi:DNA (cytosine-5)-methyltransferase 1
VNLLDLYCAQGGASAGYVKSGFRVYGNDISAQPRYPFMFTRGDALLTLERLLSGDSVPFGDGGGRIEWLALSDFAAIHASPPCQLYSLTHRINKSDFPDLIAPTRELLIETGLPYVIENVMEAAPEMRNPAMLCGAMFGLETYRHRLFETNWYMPAPGHPEHVAKTTKMGRPVKPGEFMHVVGNFTGVDHGRKVMGMDWANRDGLREAIPPAYSEWVGRALMEQLAVAA